MIQKGTSGDSSVGDTLTFHPYTVQYTKERYNTHGSSDTRDCILRRDYTPIFGGSGPLDGWINGSQVGLTPLPDPRHLPVVIARGAGWVGWGCSHKLRARVYFHELRA